MALLAASGKRPDALAAVRVKPLLLRTRSATAGGFPVPPREPIEDRTHSDYSEQMLH